MSDEEAKLIEWGTFTEVVRRQGEDMKELKQDMKEEFEKLNAQIGRRCTDCGRDDHERRLRWLEGKMLAIGGAGAAIVLFINRILK